MSRRLAAAAIATATLAVAPGARADVDYFKSSNDPTKVTIHVPNDRTTSERLLIGGLLAGVAAAGAVGGWFNWQSHEDAVKVSAHTPTGLTWTSDLQATEADAHREGVRAAICYGVAGAFVAGVVIAALRTDPGERVVAIDPAHPQAMIAPVPGGAVIGATWGF
jgi:hypothetical protein